MCKDTETLCLIPMLELEKSWRVKKKRVLAKPIVRRGWCCTITPLKWVFGVK